MDRNPRKRVSPPGIALRKCIVCTAKGASKASKVLAQGTHVLRAPTKITRTRGAVALTGLILTSAAALAMTNTAVRLNSEYNSKNQQPAT